MTPDWEHMDIYPIAAGNIAMVRLCLENGADVNSFGEWQKHEDYMRADTPLLLLVARSRSMEQTLNLGQITCLLIKYGTDPNFEERNGMIACTWAVKCGRRAVVESPLGHDQVHPNSEINPSDYHCHGRRTRTGCSSQAFAEQ